MFDGQGSGVIIREDGYILTNSHVVDGADKIDVRLKDGHTYPAEIRGVDLRSDIAVVRIQAKGLPVVAIADSDRTRVGEFAIAIGAPFNLDYSVTFGHVSAKGRAEILPSNPPNVTMDQDFIQTDASINPGNSGGPLVNIEGELIGINSMIRGLHTGIGFAIPSNLARDISDMLITDGKVVRARLGIEVGGIHEDERLRDQTFKGAANGVFVFGIKPEGPAAKSDLKLEDIITSIDGRVITSAQHLRNAIRNKAGVTVTLDVVRNGRPVKVAVRPEEWQDEPVVAAINAPAPPEASANLYGLTVKPLTRELAKLYQAKSSDGVVVTGVDANSPADRSQIKPGDIIIEVDRHKLTSPLELRTLLMKADLQAGVRLNLLREGFARVEILKTPKP
jgi:serine protease Do